MFWRFGFHNSSVIDSILERDGATLEDIMGEDDLVQEVKSQSPKLIDFLCKPVNIEKLLGYITADDLDEAKKFKFPFVASEVFGCEIFAICEALVMNSEIFGNFWKLLEKPAPLNPLQASYFSRVNYSLLNRRTGLTLAFIRSYPNAVKLLLNHIGTSTIADLILRLITAEDAPDGVGIIKWLGSQGLISHLFSQLDPNLDPEIHTTASQTLIDIITVSYQSQSMPEQTPEGAHPSDMPPSFFAPAGNTLVDEMKSKVLLQKLVLFMLDQKAPHATSSLTHGINIIVELIRKYCSEIENAEIQHHDYLVQVQANRQCPRHPTPERLNALSVDMNDLLHVVKASLPEFVKLLATPRSLASSTDPAYVRPVLKLRQALGSERLKICELFAEFLHLQYLFTSSPLFDSLIMPPPYTSPANEAGEIPAYVAPTDTVIDGLMSLTDSLVDGKIMVVCISHFFQFRWNNFFHSIVYDMIAKVFNTYSYTSSIPTPLAMAGPAPSAADLSGSEIDATLTISQITSQKKMRELRISVKRLVVSIFKDAHLMAHITDAQHQNDYEVEQPKGVRLGYMGHLTYISDEVCKLFDKCNVELDDELHDFMNSDQWSEYVSHPLRETRERDRQPLGGTRPEIPIGSGPAFAGSTIGYNPGNGKFGEDMSDSSKPRKKSEVGRDGSDEEEDGTAAGSRNTSGESDTFNDQFARYLCQQLVKDLPDRFLGGDSSDDDEDAEHQWMNDLEGQDVSFDIAEAIQMDDPFVGGSRAREPDEETLSDDMASSRVDGDDENQSESRGASNIEGSSDADGAFNTKDLEQALYSVNNNSAFGESSSETNWADFSNMGAVPPTKPPTSEVE
ncbi:sporulation-induced protein [Batrachochytrium dendrobatidis]|nr:sporulation-induced protein [Batrachochytrium dendrobatidis]